MKIKRILSVFICGVMFFSAYAMSADAKSVPKPVFEEKDFCENCKDGFIDISDKLFYIPELEFLKAVYLFSGPPRHGLHRFKFRIMFEIFYGLIDELLDFCRVKIFIDFYQHLLDILILHP